MKRHVQTVGVREWAGDDLVELQREPLAALDAFFAEYGPCVVQGCEITAREDGSGTFDVGAGLVALEADDPDGVRRVMTMPFPGAAGVALPLYLTATVEPLTDVYGDGKVKPIAYVYAAQASGVDPGESVPHLTLTADGGNRFVDAVQDSDHRFVSDTDRARWNSILSQAKAYADSVSATGSEAALRTAKEYTDARETAILASADTKDADTLQRAKTYADQIVAALAGSAPETLDTLQELAAALGDDPNFSATVMQMLGERVTTEALAAALAGKLDKTGGAVKGKLSLIDSSPVEFIPQDGASSRFQLYAWDKLFQLTRRTPEGAYLDSIFDADYDSGVVDFSHNLTVDHHPVWHSGNFDAGNAMTWRGRGTLLDQWGSGYGFTQGDTPVSGHSSSYLSFGMAGYEVEICLGGYSAWLNGWNRIFFRSRDSDNGSVSDWKEFYHTGNLGSATASSAGLMSAEDKQKLDGITGIVAAGRIEGGGKIVCATVGVAASYNASGKYYTLTFPNTNNPVLQVTPFDKDGKTDLWGKVCCTIKTLTTSSAQIVMTDSGSGEHIQAGFCFSLISC